MKDKTTEEKILIAAFEEFRTEGYSGARMRTIADKAKINKGLLHYYFKTKDKLFEKIFSFAVQQIQSSLREIFQLEISVNEKLERIIDVYFETMKRNPELPRFVINEINKNPKNFLNKNINPLTKAAVAEFIESLQQELDRKNIVDIKAEQIMINLFSMVIFPFVGKPIIQLMFNFNDKDFDKIINERKIIIKNTILGYLKN